MTVGVWEGAIREDRCNAIVSTDDGRSAAVYSHMDKQASTKRSCDMFTIHLSPLLLQQPSINEQSSLM